MKKGFRQANIRITLGRAVPRLLAADDLAHAVGGDVGSGGKRPLAIDPGGKLRPEDETGGPRPV